MKNFYLEQLMAVMPQHVYWLDKDNVYQGCNDNQAKAFGLNSRQEIVGKRNRDLAVIKESIADAWDQNNLVVIESGVSMIIQEVSIVADGSYGTVLSHKIPLRDEKGLIIGLLGISIDITDLKKQADTLQETIEQKDLPLKQILSNMPGHVYWKNKEGVYLGCNDRQANTLGFSCGEEVVGKTDFDLSWGHVAGSICRENDIRIMSSGISQKIEETALIDGQELVYLSLKTPLKNDANQTVGILGISIDISKQKEFEKKLMEAKEIAENANAAKTQFLYNMQHDLRTPFSGILGIAQFMEQSEQDLEKKENLGYISQSAEALLEHLNQIFELMHMESGQLSILDKQFNLHTLIKDIFNMMRPSAKNKGLMFTLALSEDLPVYLIGDPLRTQRVLINIIANSIKFTETGCVKLEVVLAKKEHRECIIKFTIEDTGIGIPEDKVNTVFEHFNRLSPSYTNLYPGKGLGLRIVKKFLDEMSGEVHLHSELKKGTVFKILIPFKATLLNCPEEQL